VCLSLMSGRLGVTVCSLVLGILLDYSCTTAIFLLSGSVLGECRDYFIMLFSTLALYADAHWIIRVFSVFTFLHNSLTVNNYKTVNVCIT
jgi:hypothetical protein